MTTQAGYQVEVSEATRAGCRVIWTQTREEQRAERLLVAVAASLRCSPFTWSITTGLTDLESRRSDPAIADLTKLFSPDYTGQPGRQLIILKDASPYLDAAPDLRRAIRDEIANTKRRSADNAKIFIFVDVKPAPDSLPGIYRAALELPNRAEIATLVDTAAETLPDDARAALDRAAVVEALTGLDSEVARDALNRSRVKTGTYDARTLIQEKRAMVSSAALEWSEPDPRGLDAIGGLDLLKKDLVMFRAAISPDARAYGLPVPKGFLLAGIPGTGKSLSARAAAAAFGLPLIRLNVGALMGKFVGESEGNFRAAINQIKALAPCVLHLDELEKALSGTQSSGDSDGGTTARLFGELLTFMQDRTEIIFLIATANKISALPPELKRAGRFDRIFFIDCPTRSERAQIARVMGRKYARAASVNPDEVARATEGYTGAEIEEVYRTALYTAFNDGQRDATTKDAIEAVSSITPIARSEAAALADLRKWAETGARKASSPETLATASVSGAEFNTEA